MDGVMFFTMMVVSALLALIPANIAKQKGRSFGLWWLYGCALWIVAFIHSIVITDESAKQEQPDNAPAPNPCGAPNDSWREAAEELKKCKELLDDGILTEDEFKARKERLLKLI